MIWRRYIHGVSIALIDNTNILSGGFGDALLRLRRRFMRTSYMPRDVPEYLINVSSELND